MKNPKQETAVVSTAPNDDFCAEPAVVNKDEQSPEELFFGVPPATAAEMNKARLKRLGIESFENDEDVRHKQAMTKLYDHLVDNLEATWLELEVECGCFVPRVERIECLKERFDMALKQTIEDDREGLIWK